MRDIGFEEPEHHGCGIHTGPGTHPPWIPRGHGLLKRKASLQYATIVFSLLAREAAPDCKTANKPCACASPAAHSDKLNSPLTGASVNSQYLTFKSVYLDRHKLLMTEFCRAV